jgi:DNA-binding MarR family transcriptional regulator
MDGRELHNYRVLSQIESGRMLTQRSLALELGIALGLANLLIKRLVKKGYVKTAAAIRGRRLKYILTPEGIAEKARLSVAYVEHTVSLYTETRDRILNSFTQIASERRREGRCRIVFYGAGDVAEIAYVALDKTQFVLVGVVDDYKTGRRFFGHTIASPQELAGDCSRCDFVVVSSFKRVPQISARLGVLKVPAEKIVFL